jgi:hypothetical protein
MCDVEISYLGDHQDYHQRNPAGFFRSSWFASKCCGRRDKAHYRDEDSHGCAMIADRQIERERDTNDQANGGDYGPPVASDPYPSE